MAAAFHHQPQIMFTSKIYRCCDVLRIPCRDRVHAWLGSPRIDPSQGLREPRLIADVKGISQILCETLGSDTARIGFQSR
jgi:hypothetical protein